MARFKCVVPDCGGVIDAVTPGAVPCPECVKRVQVAARLREHVRALEGQLLDLQKGRLARVLPLLRAIAKKAATARELAAALKRPHAGMGTALLKLEARGLVTLAEFRRENGGAVGRPVWRLSSLGERVVQGK